VSGDGCDDGDSVDVASNRLSAENCSDTPIEAVTLGAGFTGVETESPSGSNGCESRKLPAVAASSPRASSCSDCSPSSRWSSSAFGGDVQISMPGGVRERGEGRNSVASA
jgi:hypothetical protein